MGRVWSGANATFNRILADVEGKGRFHRFGRVERNGGMRTRQGVVDAEDRIALAREYYNNIAENYETRRRTFPHSLVAALWRLPEAKFFKAEGFEAKTVDVDLEA